jgi:GntR family transcriptional regulator, arabinose operon transcriptional repressor
MSIVELPKYERVKLAIIEDIEQGRLEPGSLIPSEAELLERFDVSRPTLVRSFQDLVREGWVHRKQGKGTFVADRAARLLDLAAPDATSVPLFVHSRVVRQVGDAKEVLIHLMRGVQTALEDAGYSLVMRSIPDITAAEIDKFLGARAPGPALVVEPSSTPLLWNELRSRGWNAWAILDKVDDGNCVYIDQEYSGYLAARYLLNKGCRNVALLNGPPAVYWGFKARLAGYQRALAEFQIPFRPELALEGAHVVDSEAGRAMLRSLVEAKQTFDGVIGASDGKAIGAMMAAEEAGLEIGRDVQFVSIDNTVAEFAPHPLSSVKMAFEEAGRLAASLAISPLFAAGSTAVHTQSKLVPTLVER